MDLESFRPDLPDIKAIVVNAIEGGCALRIRTGHTTMTYVPIGIRNRAGGPLGNVDFVAGYIAHDETKAAEMLGFPLFVISEIVAKVSRDDLGDIDTEALLDNIDVDRMIARCADGEGSERR